MELLLPTLMLIVILGAVWYVARPKVVFVIKFRQGQPRIVRGHASDAMLSSIQDICRQNEVTTGTISAVPAGRRVRMKFSREIPQGCQQQIRNMMLSGSVNDIRLSRPR